MSSSSPLSAAVTLTKFNLSTCILAYTARMAVYTEKLFAYVSAGGDGGGEFNFLYFSPQFGVQTLSALHSPLTPEFVLIWRGRRAHNARHPEPCENARALRATGFCDPRWALGGHPPPNLDNNPLVRGAPRRILPAPSPRATTYCCDFSCAARVVRDASLLSNISSSVRHSTHPDTICSLLSAASACEPHPTADESKSFRAARLALPGAPACAPTTAAKQLRATLAGASRAPNAIAKNPVRSVCVLSLLWRWPCVPTPVSTVLNNGGCRTVCAVRNVNSFNEPPCAHVARCARDAHAPRPADNRAGYTIGSILLMCFFSRRGCMHAPGSPSPTKNRGGMLRCQLICGACALAPPSPAANRGGWIRNESTIWCSWCGVLRSPLQSSPATNRGGAYYVGCTCGAFVRVPPPLAFRRGKAWPPIGTHVLALPTPAIKRGAVNVPVGTGVLAVPSP